MKLRAKTCLVILVLFAAFVLVACEGRRGSVVSPTSGPSETPTPSSSPTPTPVRNIKITSDNSSITSVYLDEKDKTVFTIALKDNILFSDGRKVCADDIKRFIEESLWLYQLKSQQSKLYDVPFYGKDAFLCNLDYIKYIALCNDAEIAIDNGKDAFKSLDLAHPIEGYVDFFFEKLDEGWLESAKKIVEVCKTNYADYANKGYMGSYTSKSLDTNEGLAIAFGMTMWGFGYFEKDGATFYTTREKAFNTEKGEYPTYSDLVDEAKYLYLDDVRAYDAGEMTDEVNFSVIEYAKLELCKEVGFKESNGDHHSLAALHKVDDLTLEVIVDGKCDFDAYEVFDINASEDSTWEIKPEQVTELNRETK